MEKVGPNSKFVGHFTEIIQQSKIKGPLQRAKYCDYARTSQDMD